MPKVIDVPGQGRVSFPDSMSEAEIVEAIQRTSTQSEGMRGSVFVPRTEYSGVAETARAALQGPTFGFGEEIEAGIRAPFSDKSYEQIRNQLRGQQSQFKRDYPMIAGPVEITGAVAGPMAAFKALGSAGTALQSALTGKTLAGQAARGAAVGGVTGALSGAGASEKDISGAALQSGVTGSVLGATVPLAIRGAGNVIKNVLTASGLGDQPLASSKIIANALKKDDLTPDEAASVLDELRRVGVPNPVLADISKSMQDLAYAAYVIPSTQKAKTAQFLESRMIDQPSDIVKGLVKNAGLGKNVNGYEYLDFLTKNQQSAASAKYPLAYSKAIDARDFRKYVDRPVFQDAYKEAQKRAGVYGDTLPDLEQIRNAQFVPTDVLHKMKIGLDRIVESNTDPITGKMTAYGRDVSNVKREFNNLIKDKNPDYAKANAEFADNERIRSSFETGQKYQRLEYKEALDKLKKMNDSEKEAFRLGMMADVNSRLENFKGGDFSRQIFKSDKQKSLLRYAFTDEGKYKKFVNYVDGLSSQTKTAKALMGGSQTGERLATSESLGDLGQIAQSTAQGGLAGGTMATARSLLARTRGISSETSAELQKRLFAVDPVEQRAILEELKRRSQTKPVGVVPGAAAIGTLTGLLGN